MIGVREKEGARYMLDDAGLLIIRFLDEERIVFNCLRGLAYHEAGARGDEHGEQGCAHRRIYAVTRRCRNAAALPMMIRTTPVQTTIMSGLVLTSATSTAGSILPAVREMPSSCT